MTGLETVVLCCIHPSSREHVIGKAIAFTALCPRNDAGGLHLKCLMSSLLLQLSAFPLWVVTMVAQGQKATDEPFSLWGSLEDGH